MDVSLDKSAWLIWVNGPTIPPTYYVYDLNAAQITPLGSLYPADPAYAI